ncbi:unnamed protein product [Clonostachys solani]|uniref:Uncharacterized protein n=1 Tax=Clonostachys solani TaxID=160281 RepID=A0A9N9VZH5_9HYPO|nr:unnamed protein product [Clonostachys solani]
MSGAGADASTPVRRRRLRKGTHSCTESINSCGYTFRAGDLLLGGCCVAPYGENRNNANVPNRSSEEATVR